MSLASKSYLKKYTGADIDAIIALVNADIDTFVLGKEVGGKMQGAILYSDCRVSHLVVVTESPLTVLVCFDIYSPRAALLAGGTPL